MNRPEYLTRHEVLITKAGQLKRKDLRIIPHSGWLKLVDINFALQPVGGGGKVLLDFKPNPVGDALRSAEPGGSGRSQQPAARTSRNA